MRSMWGRRLPPPTASELAIISPWARPSPGAWNGGSSASASTGPKPCMPPMSWTASIDPQATAVGEITGSRCRGQPRTAL
jgi:hypothetical protein